MMDQSTIARYQPGGDIYAAFLAQYGQAAADSIATAALTGDETQINAVLTQVKYGAPLDTSTASILGAELVTDPFGAPLADLNSILSNAAGSAIAGVITNPFVLLAAAGIVFYLYHNHENVRTIIEKVK